MLQQLWLCMDIKIRRLPVPTTLDKIAPGELFMVHTPEGTWTALMAISGNPPNPRSIVLAGPSRAGHEWPGALDVNALGGVVSQVPNDGILISPDPLADVELGESGPRCHGGLTLDSNGEGWLLLQNSPHDIHVSLKTGALGEPQSPVLHYPSWAIRANIGGLAYLIAQFKPKS